ncbi:hypothetical protein MXB_2796 [Myxobolus squamalis]|nr:hypothetical protein MXB_2796 [Myxobolus squamalis]
MAMKLHPNLKMQSKMYINYEMNYSLRAQLMRTPNLKNYPSKLGNNNKILFSS